MFGKLQKLFLGPACSASPLACAAARQAQGVGHAWEFIVRMCSGLQTDPAHRLCRAFTHSPSSLERVESGRSPGWCQTDSSWRTPTHFFLLSCERLLERSSEIVLTSFYLTAGLWCQIIHLARMNKNGKVTEINSRIRKEPFSANYELVGKELGRWVCWMEHKNAQRLCSNIQIIFL